MTITVTSPQQTALEGRFTQMAMFAYLDFLDAGMASAPIRVTTWNHDLVWGTFTWNGLGSLAGVQEVRESEKLETSSVDLSLNVADPTILALALGESERYRGRTATLFLGPMTDGVLVDTPITCWSGYMDMMTINFSTNGSVALRCKPTAERLSRPSGLRVNQEQQKLILSTDVGFQYQADLIANPQVWLSKNFQASQAPTPA